MSKVFNDERKWRDQLDVQALLSSGAMEGPARPTRPLTLTWRMRLVRAVKSLYRSALGLRA